ncbi:MAG: hypothetical protein WC514_01510 [Candidatus Paceibacterota bacterium]
MESYRQGDIAFFQIAEIPEGFVETEGPLEIPGESGLHLHRIAGVEVFKNTAVAERPNNRGPDIPVAIIRAFEDTPVIHDVQQDNETPHPVLTLPPGIYEVRQARQPNNRIGD